MDPNPIMGSLGSRGKSNYHFLACTTTNIVCPIGFLAPVKSGVTCREGEGVRGREGEGVRGRMG